MSATGGSIIGLGLAGRNFSVAADASVERGLGGSVNDTQMNGDGSDRTIKTRTAWMLGGIKISVDDVADDHTFLQDLADQNGKFDVDIEYINGTTWGGVGQINGEITYSNDDTTATITLKGSGRLAKQA